MSEVAGADAVVEGAAGVVGGFRQAGMKMRMKMRKDKWWERHRGAVSLRNVIDGAARNHLGFPRGLESLTWSQWEQLPTKASPATGPSGRLESLMPVPVLDWQ